MVGEPRLEKHECGFSALQRAEIAEIVLARGAIRLALGFSALQRAEIAEIVTPMASAKTPTNVSVLFNEPKLLKFQSAEPRVRAVSVSVLFNEPKLLKSAVSCRYADTAIRRFSALQRAEIAEIDITACDSTRRAVEFQCSSTSRNC